MIFSSFEYVVFFAAVTAAMLLLRGRRVKQAVLLAASYFFYAYWDWRFVCLMFAMTAVNYAIGRRIAFSEDAAANKRWLFASVVFNLGVLGVFKYFNFFLDSANAVLDLAGVRLPMLEVILPVGISFITFEVMSYVIDLYRRSSPPAESFWDLALLVAFFPIW